MSVVHPPDAARRPRRRGPRQVVVIDLVLVLGLLALLPQTLALNEGPRRFPVVTIAVLLGLLALDLLMELVPAVRRRLAFLESDLVPVTKEVAEIDAILHEQEEEQDQQARQERDLRVFTPGSALAWLIAAGVSMYYVGYLVTTPVFLAAFFLFARVPLKVALGITLTMSMLNYFVFYEFLGMR